MQLDSISALFSNAWNRYKEQWKVLVLIYVVPFVLFGIAIVLIAHRTLPALMLAALIYLVGIIFSIPATSASISAVGNSTNFIESYNVGFKLFWSYLLITLMMIIAVIGGYVLLVVPGIILAVQLSLSFFILVIEGKHGISALRESRAYVKGHWWAFLGRGLLLGIIVFVPYLIIVLPARLLLGMVLGSIVYLVVLIFFAPFMICYQYEVFDNLRRLKPSAAEDATKEKHEFITVAMVVGVIGTILGIIFLVAIMVFFGGAFKNALLNNPQTFINGNPGGSSYSPGLSDCPNCGGASGLNSVYFSPTSGPIGTTVIITDPDISQATDTILMNGFIAAQDVPLSKDGKLQFVIPANLTPDCGTRPVCPQLAVVVKPGDYDIMVKDDVNGNLDEGTFTVN